MRKLVFSIFVAVLAASILFVSCSQDPAKPSSYTIKFNANGGTGTMEEMVVSNGDSVALPRGTFTSAEGNQFVGWNTKSDYTGDIYTDEEKFVPHGETREEQRKEEKDALTDGGRLNDFGARRSLMMISGEKESPPSASRTLCSDRRLLYGVN